MKINKSILFYFCFSTILYSCLSEDKKIDQGQTKPKKIINRSNESKITEDFVINFIPCANILNSLEEIPGVTSANISTRDWTRGNVILSPEENWKWDRDNFSTKTSSYKYMDSIEFYTHRYQYLGKSKGIDLEEIIKNLNGKELYKISIGLLGERVFMYFIERTEEYDIIVVDIPANWNSSYNLRQQFQKDLIDAFSCTFLICDKSKPCEFMNAVGGTHE